MSQAVVSKDVVVIGGGISGLATAYRLQQQGLDVLLVEISDRVGGSIQTEVHDGFLVDCGPNSTLDTSPEIGTFIDQLGLSSSRLYANEKASRRYILRGGRLRPLPMKPPAFLASDLFSMRAKLRLLREPFIAPASGSDDESLASFVHRRLGQEFLDYAVNPFTAGVYAGDPARLSVQSAFKKLYDLEQNYGSLIKGAIKGAKERKKRAEVAKDRARLFSFRRGMVELIERLSSEIGDEISTRTTVSQIEPLGEAGNGFSIYLTTDGRERKVRSSSVVVATPAYVAAELVERMDPKLAVVLNQIAYPPVAVVFLGFKNDFKSRPLDGFGFLVPEVEHRRILGTIWNSTIFPGRVPDGGAALTTFVGGMRQPEIAEKEDEEVVRIVTDELADIMGLSGTPTVVRVKRWRRAIPQYEIGHAKRLAAIEAFEKKTPGFFISGNYRGGISVGDCIVASLAMSERVESYCKEVTCHE